MKKYRITYYLKPEADNITIEISAKDYEEACIYAKDYRRGESFSCDEIESETADYFGTKVKIPNGYHLDSNGYYMDGHGVEYALVSYGRGEEEVVCLETVYSKHTRTVELERA